MPEELKDCIPAALRLLRQESGKRQIDVSRISGLSKAMVSTYEGEGKALPSLPSLDLYLAAVDKDFADLQRAIDTVRGIVRRDNVSQERTERDIGRAVIRLLSDFVVFHGPQVEEQPDVEPAPSEASTITEGSPE